VTDVLLELKSVGATIAGTEILSDISVTVERGQSIGLVGETGSGKSMACRLMSGMIRHVGGSIIRGQIQFEGRDVTQLSEKGWRQLRGSRIGYIAQNSLSSLNPVMTVGSQLREAIHLQRDRALPWSDECQLLEMVEMAQPKIVADSYPHQLSGGMRQRVAIALGIAGAPDLLIADEPTTALDVTIQKEILDLLSRLTASSGMSLVLVSHDLSLVAEVCEHVNVLYAGTTVEFGSVGEVMGSPAHAYTAALLGAMPGLATAGHRLTAIPGAPPDPRAWPVGCRFAPRCEFAQPLCCERLPQLMDVTADHQSRCVRMEEKPWLTAR
jgi:oligopeptide/dipeptide ABC transporter ATP-binding protein